MVDKGEQRLSIRCLKKLYVAHRDIFGLAYIQFTVSLTVEQGGWFPPGVKDCHKPVESVENNR